MFDVIVDMSSVGRTFTPDIFVHQCCQRSLHIFSVMRCIKDSWIKEMFDVIVDMSMCRENFYTRYFFLHHQHTNPTPATHKHTQTHTHTQHTQHATITKTTNTHTPTHTVNDHVAKVEFSKSVNIQASNTRHQLNVMPSTTTLDGRPCSQTFSLMTQRTSKRSPGAGRKLDIVFPARIKSYSHSLSRSSTRHFPLSKYGGHGITVINFHKLVFGIIVGRSSHGIE